MLRAIRQFLSERRKEISYLLVLTMLLSLSFSIIEFFKPYYFLQDDNRDGYLPFMFHNIPRFYAF